MDVSLIEWSVIQLIVKSLPPPPPPPSPPLALPASGRGKRTPFDRAIAMAPKGKKPAPMPGAAAKKAMEKKSTANPLFEKKPKTFGIGQSLPPPRDVGRFVRWPRYIRIQRQRRILYKRLKV